jgi:hypothetical protein
MNATPLLHPLTRRQFLGHAAAGIGTAALATLLNPRTAMAAHPAFRILRRRRSA